MKPTRNELSQEFLRGRNCAQCVLGRYAQSLGYDVEETDRMAACFGGGMFMGDACGAVTGALMVIGLAAEQGEAKEKALAFEEAFRAKCGSCRCRDLLGCDLSDPQQEQAAVASGKLIEYCPTPVLAAMDILDELLEDVL
ncbi:MAG: C_GCAxxG_C_C family protein [Oscillospiraceae bacterium]|nr:C_GCAxxG_C_C family protein [Oscillospiraceae bacterium]